MKLIKDLDLICTLEKINSNNVNVSFNVNCSFDSVIVGLKKGNKHKTKLVKELITLVKRAYKKENIDFKNSDINEDLQVFQALESEGIIKPLYFQDETNTINVYSEACEGVVNANLYQNIIVFTYKDKEFMVYLNDIYEIDISDLLDTFFFYKGLEFDLPVKLSKTIIDKLEFNQFDRCFLRNKEALKLIDDIFKLKVKEEVSDTLNEVKNLVSDVNNYLKGVI